LDPLLSPPISLVSRIGAVEYSLYLIFDAQLLEIESSVKEEHNYFESFLGDMSLKKPTLPFFPPDKAVVSSGCWFSVAVSELGPGVVDLFTLWLQPLLRSPEAFALTLGVDFCI